MAEVGKGSNQLADYRPVERAIEADAAMQERKAAAKAKKEEENFIEIMDKSKTFVKGNVSEFDREKLQVEQKAPDCWTSRHR